MEDRPRPGFEYLLSLFWEPDSRSAGGRIRIHSSNRIRFGKNGAIDIAECRAIDHLEVLSNGLEE